VKFEQRPDPRFEAPIPHHAGSRLRVGVVGIGVVVLAGLGLWAMLPRGKRPERVGTVEITRATTNGRVTAAAISPDGRFLVYALDEAGKQGLWVRQVSTQSDVRVDAPGDFGYGGFTFSRDGEYVYAVRSSGNEPSALVRLPLLGGAPVEVRRGVDTPVTFSPDETRIAYARGYPEKRTIALMVADASGADEQQLSEIDYSISFFVAPSWSPDGERIAWVDRSGERGAPPRLAMVRVREGAVESISTPAWRQIGRLAWIPDGSALVVTASEDDAPAAAQLWLVEFPSGKTRRLTNDLEDYRNVSLTADGKTVAAIQSVRQANIWAVVPGATGQPTRLTTGSFDGLGGVAWMPDGRIVFTARTGNEDHLWIADGDGANRRQLTTGEGSDMHPAVSPDGRTIAFASNRKDRRSIWKTDVDGGQPVLLTGGIADSNPDFSPDGRWIVYVSRALEKSHLARVSIDGGESTELTDGIAMAPSVSPTDGSLAAWYRFDPLAPPHLVVFPPDGGAPTTDFGALSQIAPPRWTVDGRAISYVAADSASNVLVRPIDGGEARPVTGFESERIFSFA